MKVVGLIQAHHRGWGGALDFSLALVEGKYAIEEVIARLKAVPQINAITIAVPDDHGNQIFREIAARHGVSCFFGSRENVLVRCAGALDAEGADVAVHVMGQHCFIDSALLSEMVQFLATQAADYVSLPDDFTPYFAGKVYRNVLLDKVASAIALLPAENNIHLARFAAFIEHHRDQFRAVIYSKVPQYDREYLLRVRDMARAIFSDDRMHVDASNASKVSNPLFESYEFAATKFGPADRVIDIACGDGYGCRILSASAGEVLGIDINADLIANNVAGNVQDNVRYAVDNAFDLSLADGTVTGATAMELIEHIPLDKVDMFVGEVRRVVAPGGSFICSTPQNSHGDIPVVPHHVKEYSMAELKTILTRHFSRVKIYSSKSGGRLTEDEIGQKMVAFCQ
jgi:spore coat polysaccharide biosynthesis protein SpsF (cytidylyltransferase family)/ubiquinone/menaquinone biosynthesis C-methylase UbiE